MIMLKEYQAQKMTIANLKRKLEQTHTKKTLNCYLILFTVLYIGK